MRRLIILILVVGFCSITFLGPAPVYAGDKGIKVGTLHIKAVKGSRKNLIVKSSSDVVATFRDTKGKTEHYIGEMGIKLGLDISHKTTEELGYVVFSASTAYKTGSYALQGKYFGQKASAAVGGGMAVQILIGGFQKSFTLQPLALGLTEGVGASLGLGYLYLQKDPTR